MVRLYLFPAWLAACLFTAIRNVYALAIGEDRATYPTFVDWVGRVHGSTIKAKKMHQEKWLVCLHRKSTGSRISLDLWVTEGADHAEVECALCFIVDSMMDGWEPVEYPVRTGDVRVG